ncbi:MAG: hypothetical protein ACOQNV_02930 [Mycoplasmoidaceae bacterium]
MIAAILVVPLVYFINAFLIGRLIKRWKINANPFLASIVGFIALFDVFYLISIWMYAGRAMIWTYFVVFGIIQGILLVFYIANWRYLFITWSVNYKKIITFVITFGLTVLIGWLNFRSYNSTFGTNWLWTIRHSQLDIWQPMWFGTTSDDIVSNFSAFNVMNVFWINIFKVYNIRQAINFCGWSWTIVAAGFVACLSTWMIRRETSVLRIVFSSCAILLFVVLILAFIESFAIGDAWLLLLLLVYLLVMFKQSNAGSLKLFHLTALLLGFLAVSCTSFFTVIAIWIFSIYYVIRNKENSLNFALFLTWPLILTIFSLLSLYTSSLLSIVSALYLAVVIITIIIVRRVGTPSWDTKIALSIHRHSGQIVYAGLILFVALILVANFFIFQEIYKWNGDNINYKNFLTFTYTYLWTININSPTGIAIFNALMYAIFVSITIAYLIIRKLKTHRLNKLCKEDYSIKFGILSCILFINPLVIHVLKIATSRFPLNTLDLNMLFVVPIFALILKGIFNNKINQLNQWKYNWY